MPNNGLGLFTPPPPQVKQNNLPQPVQCEVKQDGIMLNIYS